MKAIQEWLGHATFNITANLYSHLEYNAKVASAETIARVLGGDKKSEETAETKADAEAEQPATPKGRSRKKKNETIQDESHLEAV